MGPPRILIIDDEPTLTFFMEQSLAEDQRYQVDIAKSGEGALRKLREQEYDLIIVDLRLPDINGLKVIEMATELQPGTPTILMTAYGSQEVEKEAQRLGVWGYVIKPFNMEEMKATIHQALDAREKCAKGESRGASEDRRASEAVCSHLWTPVGWRAR